VPWLQTAIADPDGYRIGRMADSGLPISVSPFDQRHHANANIGVFAASGQGKSFLIGSLLIEARRHDVEAIVIDPEGEYRGLVESLGGEWLDLVSQAAINPFDLGDDDAAVIAVVGVCAALCDGIDDVERAAVEVAARQAQDLARCRGERPRLRQCLEALEVSGPRVARVLRRFLDGSLSGFLDRPTAPAWTRPLIAIGNREVPEELVPVTTLLLGSLLWELVRKVPRRRHIILDEVGMLTSPRRCASSSPNLPGAAASTAVPWWWRPRTFRTCCAARRAPWSPATAQSSSAVATKPSRWRRWSVPSASPRPSTAAWRGRRAASSCSSPGSAGA
jgi:hypothetical protein